MSSRRLPQPFAQKADASEYTAFVDLAGFGAAQTLYGDDTFVVIEKWSDADALRAHARAPHMVALVAKLKGRIASQTIHILTTV